MFCAVGATVVLVLDISQRREGPRVDPALVELVHLEEQGSAAHAKYRMPRGTSADAVDGGHLHARGSDADRPELGVVLEPLADAEGNAHAERHRPRRRY